MKIQETFQGMFKLISFMGQVLYLRRQNIENPNLSIIFKFPSDILTSWILGDVDSIYS